MSDIFPFELAVKSYRNTNFETEKNCNDHRELFIENVENILNEDLQLQSSQGCKIHNCHTHLGSKKHVSDFIEAEILFQNGYYNKNFAYLVADKIYSCMPEDVEKIIVVGYEAFSEILLCEIMDLLDLFFVERDIKCVYGVFERQSDSSNSIRYSNIEIIEEFSNAIEKTFIAFVVPINTTLTTHDKMMAKFYSDNNKYLYASHINIALVMIAPDVENNEIWHRDLSTKSLKLTDRKLEFLINDVVYYLAWVNTSWSDTSTCIDCFPHNNEYAKEKPIFEVNRESIVPMFQLGVISPTIPYDARINLSAKLNLERIIRLANMVVYHHVEQDGNHHQFYFQSDRFYHSENSMGYIEKWLRGCDTSEYKITENHCISCKVHTCSVKKCIDMTYRQRVKRYWGDNDKIIDDVLKLDFIVAPRHFSNAGLIQSVNRFVFNSTARILYFEVMKEFRGNMHAKYSDIFRLVENIRNSGQKSVIRFHYVDDSIYSAKNFTRMRNLISSLVNFDNTNDISNSCKIEIFSSAIVLIGRNSTATKTGLVGSTKSFYEYAHLSISPMRNFKDACTICQLTKSYDKIEREYVSTNEMSKYCKDFIVRHKIDDFRSLNQINANNEKKCMLIITHIIEEILSNRLRGEFSKKEYHGIDFDNNFKNGTPINKEIKEDILFAIQALYEQIQNKKFKWMDFEPYDPFVARVAFVKVISRPFFIYHLRKRQAAFEFCIEKAQEILSIDLERISYGQLSLLAALVNALSDLQSNYLIRSEVMSNLFKLANRVNGIKETSSEYITLFNSLVYRRAIKKLTSMSNDDTKTMLLEYVLIDGSEKRFFNKGIVKEQQKPTANLKSLEVLHNIGIGNRVRLLIENSQILSDGLKDAIDKNGFEGKSDKSQVPYYLENFYKMFCLYNDSKNETVVSEFYKYAKDYNELSKLLDNQSRLTWRETKHCIKLLFEDIDKISLFLVDPNVHNNEWVKYYELDDIIFKDLSESHNQGGNEADFYSQKNFNEIDCLLSLEQSEVFNDTIFMRRVVNDSDVSSHCYDTKNIIIKINGHVSDESSMYIFVKFASKNDVENYRINFDQNDPLTFSDKKHIFFIRCLLTLRSKFAKVIDDKNIDSLIEELRSVQIAKALSINKAGHHNETVYFDGQPFAKLLSNPQEFDNSFNWFNRYVQLLAHQFISKLYRNVIKREYFKNMKDYDLRYESSSMSDFLSECSEQYKISVEDNIYFIRLDVFNKYSNETRSVKIELSKNIFDENVNFIFASQSPSSVRYFFLLIILLASNAVQHQKLGGDYFDTIDELTVSCHREGSYLVVKNKLDGSDIEKKIKDIKTEMGIPPLYKYGNGITLWTLEKTINIVKNDQGKCDIDLEERENEAIKAKTLDIFYDNIEKCIVVKLKVFE